MDGSPGGMRYRAPYGANINAYLQLVQGIKRKEKFDAIVENYGKDLGLDEVKVNSIKLAASADGTQDRLIDFVAKLENGGFLRYDLLAKLTCK